MLGQRIDIHHDRSIADDDIRHVWQRGMFDGRGYPDRPPVHLRIQTFWQLDQPRALAGGDDAGLHPGSLRRALVQRGQQLLMDVVEAAVRHHDDQVASLCLARDR